MRNGIFIFIITATLALFSNAWAQTNNDFDNAQHVIENWFSDMKAANTDKAAQYLAPTFVSIHTDGIVRNKDQEIQLIKNLHMKDYHLTNFQFTQSGPSVVVTFKDTTNEKIDGKEISNKPAGRMAVLQKQNDKWIIIAYANLDDIK